MPPITRTLLAALLLVSLFSCQKQLADADDEKLAAATLLNLPYGSLPLQNMDAYLPAGRSSSTTKVMVIIHGGAWITGDKADLNGFVDTLRRRNPDYALFNINYRLSDGVNHLFPTQENDVNLAIGFINSRRAQYGLSNKFVFIGASSGGHLALLQGYKYPAPIAPKAVIAFSAPTDLNDMYTNPAGGLPALADLLATAIGGTPVLAPLLYSNGGPINFVGPATPPTLLLHGTTDPLVSSRQAVLLQNKLQLNGVPNRVILYPGAAHVDTWTNTQFFDAFNKIAEFLATHVQ